MFWVYKGVFSDANLAQIRSIDCPSARFWNEY